MNSHWCKHGEQYCLADHDVSLPYYNDVKCRSQPRVKCALCGFRTDLYLSKAASAQQQYISACSSSDTTFDDRSVESGPKEGSNNFCTVRMLSCSSHSSFSQACEVFWTAVTSVLHKHHAVHSTLRHPMQTAEKDGRELYCKQAHYRYHKCRNYCMSLA